MFKGKDRIRVKAICVFKNIDYVFVSKAYDSVKKDVFYRPIGGNVEFGEYANEAIVREIREEMGAEIINITLLKILENIFVCDGIDGHEIMFIYKADFKDASFYAKKVYEIIEDSGEKFTASWIKISKFLSGSLQLVPKELKDYLQ